MKKEDYNIINDFFNDLSLRLFDSENFDNNYFLYAKLNDSFIDYMRDFYNIEDKYRQNAKTNNMTFEDILSISRDIIASVLPNYLDKFDELLEKGLIDFSYDGEYDESYVRHEYKDGQLLRRYINICREFNYTDVEVLIHEFMHYITTKNGKIKDKIIGEFISIYFELYAIEYMYKNYDIKLEELFYDRRLLNTFIHASKVLSVEVPLLIYKSFGNLDENSYEYGKKLFKDYSKEDYNRECKRTLDLINIAKENDDRAYSIDEAHYYSLATYLAFYFRKESNLETMINLVENIQDDTNDDLDVIETLDKYNLELYSDFISVLPKSIDEYLEMFENKEKQR